MPVAMSDARVLLSGIVSTYAMCLLGPHIVRASPAHCACVTHTLCGCHMHNVLVSPTHCACAPLCILLMQHTHRDVRDTTRVRHLAILLVFPAALNERRGIRKWATPYILMALHIVCCCVLRHSYILLILPMHCVGGVASNVLASELMGRT